MNLGAPASLPAYCQWLSSAMILPLLELARGYSVPMHGNKGVEAFHEPYLPLGARNLFRRRRSGGLKSALRW